MGESFPPFDPLITRYIPKKEFISLFPYAKLQVLRVAPLGPKGFPIFVIVAARKL